MSDLTCRLHSAVADFLAASEDDMQMLASYSQMWSTLLDDVSTGLLTGNIHSETLSLAHSVASRISYIARWHLSIELEAKNISAQLHEDCDAMLRRMNALNLSDSAVPTSSHLDGRTSRIRHSTSSRTPNAEGSTPSFVPSAYEWLLDNLHNPYPTADVKAQLAAASSCQVSSINSWFLNARRRIGWTALCREGFSNCRADMINAAYRALVEEDPQHALSPELRHSFITMKVAAENIYPSTFTMDPVVKDMADDREESVDIGKCCQAKQANPRKTAEDSYPSPAQTIMESPVLELDSSVTNESDEEEDVAPPVLAGSKRRQSSMEPKNQLAPAASRPIKRLRASRTSQTLLPSPPSSTDGTKLPPDASSPRVSSKQLAQPETNNVLPSHKQYMSDMDNSKIPKSGDLTVVPYLYTALDPLLCPSTGSKSINDWLNPDFDALFTIPPPVDTTEPDFSTVWEVELFKDYSIPEHSKHAPEWPQTDVSTGAYLSEFDNLFQSIVNDTYVTPSDNILSSKITVDPHTAFLNSPIPDLPHIDWMSLLDGSDAYQSTVDSTLSRYPAVSQPLPEINLSMLQFPLTPTPQSYGDIASKSAKLDQLLSMQEAIRRMEQELQSEGIIL